MKCVTCKSEAEAICRFCGRATCLNCAAEREHESGARPKYFTQTATSAIIVENAIWCRQCRVSPG